MIKTQTEYYKERPLSNGITIKVNEEFLFPHEDITILITPEVPEMWMTPKEYKSFLADQIVAITEIEQLYGKKADDFN